MVVHVFNSCTPEVVQEDFREFKASLVHITSSRTAKTIHRDLALKKMGGERGCNFQIFQRSYCPGVKYDFFSKKSRKIESQVIFSAPKYITSSHTGADPTLHEISVSTQAASKLKHLITN